MYFTKIIAEQPFPDPIWTTNVPYERKTNMLSSTDKISLICLFDFERFSIESRFPFSFFFTHIDRAPWSTLPCSNRTLLAAVIKLTRPSWPWKFQRSKISMKLATCSIFVRVIRYHWCRMGAECHPSRVGIDWLQEEQFGCWRIYTPPRGGPSWRWYRCLTHFWKTTDDLR